MCYCCAELVSCGKQIILSCTITLIIKQVFVQILLHLLPNLNSNDVLQEYRRCWGSDAFLHHIQLHRNQSPDMFFFHAVANFISSLLLFAALLFSPLLLHVSSCPAALVSLWMLEVKTRTGNDTYLFPVDMKWASGHNCWPATVSELCVCVCVCVGERDKERQSD